MVYENESYFHKKAKEVLKEWIETRENYFLDPIQVDRENTVFLEYPICKLDNGISSWSQCWNNIWSRENVPSYQECLEHFDSKPIAIIDVVVCIKNKPSICIEVCHTNSVTEKKIQRLKKIGVTHLIEVEAEWILRQTRVPRKLVFKRLI
jgi:hypothetical protein